MKKITRQSAAVLTIFLLGATQISPVLADNTRGNSSTAKPSNQSSKEAADQIKPKDEMTVSDSDRNRFTKRALAASKPLGEKNIPKLSVYNDKGEDILEALVPTGSKAYWAIDTGIFAKERPASKSITLKYVLKPGETIDLEETKKLSEEKGWTVTYDEQSKEVTFTANQGLVDAVNETYLEPLSGKGELKIAAAVSTLTESETVPVEKTRKVPKEETYEEEVEEVEDVERSVEKLISFKHTDGRTLYKYDDSEKVTVPSDIVDWSVANTYIVTRENNDISDIDYIYASTGRNFFRDGSMRTTSIVYEAHGVTFSKVVVVNLITGEETPIDTDGKRFTITDADAPDVAFGVKYHIKGSTTKKGVGVTYKFLDNLGNTISEGVTSNEHAHKLKTKKTKKTKTRTIEVEETYTDQEAKTTVTEQVNPIVISAPGNVEKGTVFTKAILTTPSGKQLDIPIVDGSFNYTVEKPEKGDYTISYDYDSKTGEEVDLVVSARSAVTKGEGKETAVTVPVKQAEIPHFQVVDLVDPVLVTTLRDDDLTVTRQVAIDVTAAEDSQEAYKGKTPEVTVRTPAKKRGSVSVRYLDQDGNALRMPVLAVDNEEIGKSYDVTTDNYQLKTIEKDGKVYRLNPEKTKGNTKGKVAEGVTEVTYVYDVEVIFTTKWLEEGTNKRLKDDVSGKATHEAGAIDGYVFYRSEKTETGVTHYFKKKVAEKQLPSTGDRAGLGKLLGLGLLGLALVGYLRKYGVRRD